jgi:hypothetical protein
MKLELKHLAGYLPYDLKIKTTFGWDTMQTLNDYCVNIDFEDVHYYDSLETTDFKAILRPLSDLTKEIEVNGEKFVPNVKLNLHSTYSYGIFLENQYGYGYEVTDLSFNKVNKLLEWHFDIYGLIDAGLAIDLNTLNK